MSDGNEYHHHHLLQMITMTTDQEKVPLSEVFIDVNAFAVSVFLAKMLEKTSESAINMKYRKKKC